jgi:TPR repeat protein
VFLFTDHDFTKHASRLSRTREKHGLPLWSRITYVFDMRRELLHATLCAGLLLLATPAHPADTARDVAIDNFRQAVRYDDGHGVPQDFARALALYTRAARSGLVDAQYMVGRFYGAGRGVRQNPARALYWFNLAAAGGHPHAAAQRDQQRLQTLPRERSRIEAAATAWSASHPDRFTCWKNFCRYPRWTARPALTNLGLD